jgi:hypothetical protein
MSAIATARARLRGAVGEAVQVDADLHVERVLGELVRLRATDLSEDLKSRAAALASTDGTRRLRVEGA